MHELRSIALVLESVIKECVTHPDLALLALFDIDEVFELLEPHPIVDIHGLNDWVFNQLLNHIYVVDDVKDQRLHLGE